MTNLSSLSDKTVLLLISETRGALTSSDVDAMSEYGGVRESMMRYGCPGWRDDFNRRLVEYRDEARERGIS